MKLHRDSGVIEFPQGSIGPQTTRHDFLNATLGRQAEVFVDNEPFMTWRIRPEPGVTATLSFEGQQLRSVGWMLALPSDKEKYWSEALELERKRIHDKWLLDVLGAPPYRFPWGVAASTYDARACASDIMVTYDR